MATKRFKRAALAALLLVAGQSVLAQPDTITVRASPRAEIERILVEDNLDVDAMRPADVAATMAAIRRGGAPDDFWTAYRAHVAAWQAFAAADGQLRASDRPGDPDRAARIGEAVRLEQEIGVSFDAVERIARRHGARLPPRP